MTNEKLLSERLSAAQESLADSIGRTAATVGNFVMAMRELEKEVADLHKLCGLDEEDDEDVDS